MDAHAGCLHVLGSARNRSVTCLPLLIHVSWDIWVRYCDDGLAPLGVDFYLEVLCLPYVRVHKLVCLRPLCTFVCVAGLLCVCVCVATRVCPRLVSTVCVCLGVCVQGSCRTVLCMVWCICAGVVSVNSMCVYGVVCVYVKVSCQRINFKHS